MEMFKMRASVLIVLSFVLSPLLACAHTLRVPDDFELIQQAINASVTGDTIIVAPGFHSDGVGWIHIDDKGIHVLSEGGPDVTTISTFDITGVMGTCAFYIENVNDPCTISGFKMAGHRYGEMAGSEYTVRLINATNVKICNNIFYKNIGATVISMDDSSPIIEGNLFNDNEQCVKAIRMQGNCNPIITNNTVFNSGGIHISGSGSSLTINNNIVINHFGYGISCDTPVEYVTFFCNNIWNNSSGNYVGALPDQTGINGNISLNPQFCGISGSGNFYLQSGSPCSESNVPEQCNGIRIGAFPVNCETGIEEESWSKTKKRYRK